MLKKHSALICIVVAGCILRLWQIGGVPPSLSWDEVSIGYNAYSLLKTGFDEHKRFLPLDTFVAYGDYKPPMAIYLTVPFVALFGLTEAAVRLPSVLFGTLSVVFAYFLVLELFGKSSRRLALVVSGLLAISPWHIQLSRAGFEANIAVFFIVLGVYLFLKARTNSRYFYFSALPFVAAVYTFNSARYVAPLLILGLMFFCRKALVSTKKQLFVGLILASVVLLPLVPHLISKESRLRFAEVSIFTDLRVLEKANERILREGYTIWARVIHNRRWYYLQSYISHFLDHFDPRFLFIRGDGNPKFSLQDVGQLYMIEAPFLVIGVLWLLQKQPKVAGFLLFWLLVSIAPAAVARETPHALRIENSLPTWQIFIAYGIVACIDRLNRKSLKRMAIIGIGSIYFGSFGYFVHQYFTHYKEEYSREWQWGYREAIRFAERVFGSYDKIVLTDAIGRPYMYTLFYTKYDPKEYFDTRNTYFDAAGFYHVNGFGKYQFVRQSPPDGYTSNVLYVLDPHVVPESANILETIRALDGEPVLVAFTI